jgi:hypothetical protein
MPYNLKSAATHSYICSAPDHTTPRTASVSVRLGKLLELITPAAPKCPTCGSRMIQSGISIQLPLDHTWVRPSLWAQAKAALTALGA